MVAWAQADGKGPTSGQNQGRSCLASAGEARRGASSARGRRKPPPGGLLRGRAIFCGPVGDLQVLAGPLGRAGSAALGCAGQLACRRWDKAVGGERREKVVGLMREKQKQQGLG
jgi:hypothetical protein